MGEQTSSTLGYLLCSAPRPTAAPIAGQVHAWAVGPRGFLASPGLQILRDRPSCLSTALLSFAQHFVEASCLLVSLFINFTFTYDLFLSYNFIGTSGRRGDKNVWVQPSIFDHLSPNSLFYFKFQVSSNLVQLCFICIINLLVKDKSSFTLLI